MEKWTNSVLELIKNKEDHLAKVDKAIRRVHEELKFNSFFTGKYTKIERHSVGTDSYWNFIIHPIKLKITFKEVIKSVNPTLDEAGYPLQNETYSYEQIEDAVKSVIYTHVEQM